MQMQMWEFIFAFVQFLFRANIYSGARLNARTRLRSYILPLTQIIFTEN